jgi:hypothetical protein
MAMTEERSRRATEIHNRLVPDFAGILPHFEAAKGATESGRHELVRCTGSRKNNCLFFEPSKFRTSRNQALPSRYPLKLSTFRIPQPVGMEAAKPTFCMRTPFNKLNQSGGSKLRGLKALRREEER